MKPRNHHQRLLRNPNGPYRPSVVKNKKAYTKATRKISRKNLKGYTQGYDRPRYPIGGCLGGKQCEGRRVGRVGHGATQGPTPRPARH